MKKRDFLMGLVCAGLIGLPLGALAGTTPPKAALPGHKSQAKNKQKKKKNLQLLVAKNDLGRYQYTVATLGNHANSSSEALNDPPPDPNFSVKVGGGGTLTINGFLNIVGFWQDQPYNAGNGVFGTWPAPVSPTHPNATSSRSITGGDVRNTRVMISFSHPLPNGWTAGGFVSSDFEGGFAGTGIVSGEQPIPRLRQMYITLSKGDTLVKIGQQLSLLGVQFPYSLAHLAEPNGFFWANGVFWFPGVSVTQKYPMGNSNLSVSGAVLEGTFAGNVTNFETPGNTAFRPKWEGRIMYSSKTDGTPWSVFFVGHYEQINLQPPYGLPPVLPHAPESSYSSYMVEAGASVSPGKFVIKGNLIYGQGMANDLFDFIQPGAIKFHGGWVQAGYHFWPHWGIYAGYYYNQPNASDVVAWEGNYLTGKATTVTLADDMGTFGWALEWMHNIQGYTHAGVESTIVGNQVTLSAIYRF